MSSLSGTHAGHDAISQTARERWGWFLVLGIVLVLCGILAIALPLVSTLAVSSFLGALIFVAGVFHLIHAFQAKGWRGLIWDILIGLIQLIGGALIFLNPFAGAVAITAVIAWVFLLQGVAEIILALQVRPRDGWGWLLFSGIVAVLVGIWLFSRFPIAGLFVPGTIVGIALLFEGWAFIAIAMQARSMRRA